MHSSLHSDLTYFPCDVLYDNPVSGLKKSARHATRVDMRCWMRCGLSWLWGCSCHYEVFPLFAGVDTATQFGRFLTHVWSTTVFGTPAVIVFFVISGFCIHLSFRGDKMLPVAVVPPPVYPHPRPCRRSALRLSSDGDQTLLLGSDRFYGSRCSGAWRAKKFTTLPIPFCA